MSMWQQFLVPETPPFTRIQYRCYPISFKQPQLEAGDKVLLPGSAMLQLARLQVSYPMVFQISTLNPASAGAMTHCGVMEFTAEEGCAYVPHWMMENLLLSPGDFILFSNVSLPKGTFVQFQPFLTAFTELSDPKVVLERALRKFTCLTKGDRLVIEFGPKKYELEVREVRPGNAVSIIETDMTVDFFEPKDFKAVEAKREAEKAKQAELTAKKEALLAQASPALSSSSPASGPTDYFSKLGPGNRLVTKKKPMTPASLPPSSVEEKVVIHANGERSTGGNINAAPPSSSSSSILSGSSSSSNNSSSGSGGVRAGNSAGSRLLMGTAGKNGPQAPPASSDKFTYVYKTDEKQKKLMRREVKPAGFTPFAGKGNSLKD